MAASRRVQVEPLGRWEVEANKVASVEGADPEGFMVVFRGLNRPLIPGTARPMPDFGPVARDAAIQARDRLNEQLKPKKDVPAGVAPTNT